MRIPFHGEMKRTEQDDTFPLSHSFLRGISYVKREGIGWGEPPPSPPSSPPPTPSAPPPTPSSSDAPPRSESSPPPSPPLPSPAPPQSPAPTRTPDAVPIPSTPSTPLEPRNTNTSPDATGNSNPPTVFLPPPAVPAGGPPAPAAKRSPPSSAPSRPSSESPNSGNAPSSSVNNNAIIIAGIFVAAILLLSVVVICLMCNKKKKKQPYYIDVKRPPPAKGGDQQHFNGSTEWLNNPQFLQIPPQQPGGWAAVPPHSPGNISTEYSAGFSPSPLPASPPGMGGFNQSQFSYEELAAATAGFSQGNLLGQGGFGYVHKGVLTSGKDVAVKSLKTGSGQGEREFQAEVEIISRVHHRHLVSLVGYCIGQGQRMLVYEFVPNKTLEFHLHGKGQPVMDWPTRLKIAVGSAKGLAYLHEDCHPRIIHRDIKTANILLDENFEAMVMYLAPEYASSGKLTDKSDVFSYGVMLLELVTGRRPVDITNYEEDCLVDWARPLLAKALEDGNYAPLADPRLEGNFDQDEMACMAACAAASIRHSAKRRPKMSQIMHTLEGNSSRDSLNDNPKAVQSAVVGGSANDTRLYDTVAYNADMMKFREMVMASQEYSSSEYGGNTDENGLAVSSSSSNSDSTEHYGYQVNNHNRV
nr:proline-rich receptor-like protein kinase PERK1 [Ipomoea batatas]